MANRGYLARNEQFLNALNVIDVVFYKNKDIVQKWHDYKESLNPKHYQFDVSNRKLLDLLKVMATHLGYSEIEQTHIDTPLHSEEATRNAMVQDELYNFLKHANEAYDANKKHLPKKISQPKHTFFYQT